MKRITILITCLIVVSVAGTAAVSFDIETDEADLDINATFDLYAEEKKNLFGTRWSIPDRATIHAVEDTQGQIEDWEHEDGQVELTSNDGPRRNKETISIRYTIPDIVQTWQDRVHRLELELPGFSDRYEQFDEEQTQVRVQTDDPVLGLAPPNNYNYSFDDTEAILAGEGPASFRLSYTDVTATYDHYTAVGDINLTGADRTYPLLWHITGFDPQFTRSFAVIPLSPEQYNQQMDRWSAATYRQGGLIFLRNTSRSQAAQTSLLMHETMHGFNQEKLSWVQLEAGVFDEGTAQYAEYITKQKQNERYGELFGENVTWRGPCENDDGRQCRYWLSPRGGPPETLWNYYEQNLTFMQGWSPVDAGVRDFGYAFSELIIRNYMKDRDPDALHTVYEQMEDFDRVDEDDQYWQRLATLIGDLRPCDRESLDDVRSCTEAINDVEPEVPEEVTIAGGQQANLTFDPVERETVNGTNRTTLPDSTFQERKGFFEQLGDWIVQGFTRLMNLAGEFLS
ncbi:MAG: hypothetical protein MUP66_01315 [Candidatus Nanohaloarchaeota archaeon QJJ-5]|nr:hypothetical protein [Candidatus Nanohaloarchaeota archaeon QJJ-5]